MSFAGNLKRELSKLEISNKDRIEYTEDAMAIQNFVVENLKAHDPTFRRAFDGLSLGGSYLDRVKLETPAEFDLHLKLKFPYAITPKKDENGFVFLYAPNGGAPIVGSDDYIDRKSLQGWLRGVFKGVFDDESTSRRVYFRTPRNRLYSLKYTLQGQGCAHTIEAACGKRKISFDLVPAFEFTSSQFPFKNSSDIPDWARQDSWFAVPQKKSGSDDDRTFMVCAPHWEREMVKNSYNFKNVLRLMKGLKEKSEGSLPHLSSYMLKTVMLHKHSSIDWQQDEGTLLLKMWRSLVDHLRSGRLDFILAEGHNIFDRMSFNERKECFNCAQTILKKLEDPYTQQNTRALSELFP